MLRRAYKYALSLTHDPVQAEDLLQDAWVRVLSSGKARELPYLLRTIRNRFIDRYRKEKGAQLVALTEVPDEVEEDLLLERSYQRESIERALGELGPEEREILYLSWVEGYTAQEIGELQDRPRGTILSLLFRAKKKMRKLLEKKSSSTREWVR